MAPQSASAQRALASPPEPEEALRYVARQPILDASGALRAYELLFRSGPESIFRGDGDLATRTMLDNSVVFGIESLTGGLPAFINCTLDALTGDLVQLLPPQLAVLEILETVEPTPELLAACHRLKKQGFRLALDDFVWEPRFEPLIALADYIKIDFLLSGPGIRRSLLNRIQGKPIQLLAEKVETQEQFRAALAEGFTLFQGYYFCRPTLISRRRIPSNSLHYIELLPRRQKRPLDLSALIPLIKRDAALTFRLLRLVNSPLYPHHGEIRSIRAAILVVGEDAFRHLASVAIASELAGQGAGELMRMAMIRARFCELVSDALRLEASEQYLFGMFSLLPAMLRLPLQDTIATLPLRQAIRDALLGADSLERAPLTWMEAYEQADWARCEAIAAKHRVAPALFHLAAIESIRWAQSILQAAR